MTGRRGRTPTRDQALIGLAGGLAIAALMCATVLVAAGKAPGEVATTAVGGVIALAGMAVGRLGGPPPTDHPPPPPEL